MLFYLFTGVGIGWALCALFSWAAIKANYPGLSVVLEFNRLMIFAGVIIFSIFTIFVVLSEAF